MRESVDDFTVLITSYPDGDVLHPTGHAKVLGCSARNFKGLHVSLWVQFLCVVEFDHTNVCLF